MDNATAHHSSAAKLTAQPVSHRSSEFIALTLGGIGVVYGDIGTSPLYAFREAAIAAAHNAPLTRGIVLGVLSLILWALIVVVTLKYVLILLRADNNGGGGTLPRSRRERWAAGQSRSWASA
jgi:KUP system potassium uptake protein